MNEAHNSPATLQPEGAGAQPKTNAAQSAAPVAIPAAAAAGERIDSTLNGVPCAYRKAPNGNGIFIPAAGFINGTTLFYPEYYSYWTSSLFTKGSHRKYAIASRSDLTDGTRMPANRWRFYGLPIRPVQP